MTGFLQRKFLACQLEVGVDHHADQLRECDAWAPAELLRSKRGVTPQVIDLRGPEVTRVGTYVLLPVQVNTAERRIEEFTNRVAFPGSDDVVGRHVLLQHQPHRLYVVAGKSPIARRTEVAQVQLRL